VKHNWKAFFLSLSAFFCVVLNAQIGWSGDPAPRPPEDPFQNGIKLYQEQKFQEAAEQFQKEFAAGKDFAALHYNWGLAAYKLKKKGLAAGLWRRALFIDPDFRPALQALDFISKEIPKDMNEDLSNWHLLRSRILDRASLSQFLFVTWILFGLGGYLGIRYLAARREALKNQTSLPKAPTVAAFMVIAFLALALLSTAKAISLLDVHATVTENNTALHTGPSSDDNTLFDILEGFDVIVENVHAGWAQISLTSGQIGWVPVQNLFQHTGQARLW
jgi:tetratricopeptide (TPR) repeat protein